MKVWILMYQDNDYNQPPQAFSKLWWHEPTIKDIKECGLDFDKNNNIINPYSDTTYWIEEFKK